MKVIGGQSFGSAKVALMSSIAARALEGVRAERYICAGLCFESWRAVSLPSPELPLENQYMP